jgi:hypothetical protein
MLMRAVIEDIDFFLGDTDRDPLIDLWRQGAPDAMK